jgi:hypothetical protein
MVITLLSLALALLSFSWVISPLFGEAAQIPQERSQQDVAVAVSRSVQELKTDLELDKIQSDDLDHIQRFLEEESSR